MMRFTGIALILVTLFVAAYGRYAGRVVDEGATVKAGRAYYLVAFGSPASCQLSGFRIEIEPLGRELLDGVRIDSPVGGVVTCDGGQVMVTSGAPVGAYPLAEYGFIPLSAGMVLILVASFVRPRRRHEGID